MTATTQHWLVPATTAVPNNGTEGVVDMELVASLAILPTTFAGVAVIVWVVNVVVQKYCQNLDPAVAILRFSPGQQEKMSNTLGGGRKSRRDQIGPAKNVPATAPTDANASEIREPAQVETKVSGDGDTEARGGEDHAGGGVADSDEPDGETPLQKHPGRAMNRHLSVADQEAHERLQRTTTLRAGGQESRALLANLEGFARAAEQRLADKEPSKFRDPRIPGKLRNRRQLRRLVLEELTRRGTAFQFLNTVRRRHDFFEFKRQAVVHATVLTRQSFSAGRKILYTTFSGTSFSRSLVGAIIFLCYSGVFCSGAYICDYLDKTRGTDYLEQYMEHCEALHTITDSITQYVIFMTVTYAVQSLTQWINVMSHMYKIHSAVTSLGLLWSRLLPFNDHIAMEIKYKVYRWLNVLHVYVYRRVAAGGKEINHTAQTDEALREHLVVVGLLTQEEFDKIAALGVHPHAGELMIIRWLHDLCCAANLTGIGAPGILSLSEALAEIQMNWDQLHMELTQPPISWAQLMQLLIDVYLLFSPLAFLNVMFISELEIQVLPMLSSFLLSMFFLGMLGLVDIVNDPFGDDVDDFSPDSLLFSAERQLFSFLASPGIEYLSELQDEKTEFSTVISPGNQSLIAGGLGSAEVSPRGVGLSPAGNAYSRKLSAGEEAFLAERKRKAGANFGHDVNPHAPELSNSDSDVARKQQEEAELKAMDDLHRRNMEAMRANRAVHSSMEAELRRKTALFGGSTSTGSRPTTASTPRQGTPRSAVGTPRSPSGTSRPTSASPRSPRRPGSESTPRSGASSPRASISRSHSSKRNLQRTNSLADVDASRSTAALSDEEFLNAVGSEASARQKFQDGDFSFHH